MLMNRRKGIRTTLIKVGATIVCAVALGMILMPLMIAEILVLANN